MTMQIIVSGSIYYNTLGEKKFWLKLGLTAPEAPLLLLDYGFLGLKGNILS